MKRFDRTQRPVILAALAALALSVGNTLAADLNAVTIVPDQGVTDRTNMHRAPTDTSTLGVTFDADVAKRTNMQRAPGDVGGVKVIQDSAVMERTNMGDSARKPTNIPQPTPVAGEITGAKSKP